MVATVVGDAVENLCKVGSKSIEVSEFPTEFLRNSTTSTRSRHQNLESNVSSLLGPLDLFSPGHALKQSACTETPCQKQEVRRNCECCGGESMARLDMVDSSRYNKYMPDYKPWV